LGVDLPSSSGNAPGILDTSDSEKRVSFRRLVCDREALDGPVSRDAISALFLPPSISDFASSAALFILPPLPYLLPFGFSAVGGGEGGALCGAELVLFAGVEFLLLLLSCSFSPVSDALLISSLLRTSSRLCALLKPGYELCGLSSPLGLRSISGTIETFLAPRSLVVDRGESLSRSRSLLFDRRL
jgi:hypothetical protein